MDPDPAALVPRPYGRHPHPGPPSEPYDGWGSGRSSGVGGQQSMVSELLTLLGPLAAPEPGVLPGRAPTGGPTLTSQRWWWGRQQWAGRKTPPAPALLPGYWGLPWQTVASRAARCGRGQGTFPR